MTPPRDVDAVLDLYRLRGHRHYGEAVTELEHALQCATLAQLHAGASPCDDDLVAAALLHDYGHLCHDLGESVADQGLDARHELLGADALQHLFRGPVIAAIRLHVDAKRFLCAHEPGYLSGLSPASRRSLELQGGPMSVTEVDRFAATRHAGLAIAVRRFDDGGKVVGMATQPLESFRPLLLRVLRRPEHDGTPQ